MHQIRFPLGLRPRPRWGAYSVVFNGPTSKEGREERGEGRKGKRRGRGEGWKERGRDVPDQCENSSYAPVSTVDSTTD